MIKVFEAFAGIGTQAMALKRADVDFEVVGISEIDKYAINSYKAIHGEVENYGNIAEVDTKRLPYFDLFTYSFPCQDISMAGKQKGFEKNSGTRSSLLWECERIIKTKKPKYLLMENVKALTFKKNIPGFEMWLKILSDLGYKNYWKILNAKDYGVPQNRERVFCVSILEDKKEFEFPKKQELKTRLKDILEKDVDEKFYLDTDKIKKLVEIKSDTRENESPTLIQTHKLKSDKRDNPSRNRVYDVNGISPTLVTCQGGGLQPCIPIKNATKKGYINAFSGDGIDLINPSGKTRRGRVQKESIQTLICGANRGVVTDDLRIRKLTPLEYWRLMGIKDEDFYKAQKVNSNNQLYKQAGNAIVVDVLAAIFVQLFN